MYLQQQLTTHKTQVHSMNPLLINPDFTKEFVITPEPNAYIIGLNVAQEDAAALCGHLFVAVCVMVHPTGHAVPVYIYDVLPNGDPGEWKVENPDFTPELREWLSANESRALNAVMSFLGEVEPELEEYYAMISERHSGRDELLEAISAAFGGDSGIQVGSIEDLINGKIKL
jgi:hypothetical protein